MSTDRRVVVTAGSVELRRQLGPTSWVVFEELVLASTGTGGACVASVSIRTLAEHGRHDLSTRRVHPKWWVGEYRRLEGLRPAVAGRTTGHVRCDA